jgi:hypothetical protein
VKVNYQYEIYTQLTHPKGHLPNDKRAQACWFFYLMAQSAKEAVGEGASTQIIYEGELWMDKRYEQQARSVAQIYQLESPSEFMKFWSFVILQAKALGLPAPAEEYMRPMIGKLIV